MGDREVLNKLPKIIPLMMKKLGFAPPGGYRPFLLIPVLLCPPHAEADTVV